MSRVAHARAATSQLFMYLYYHSLPLDCLSDLFLLSPRPPFSLIFRSRSTVFPSLTVVVWRLYVLLHYDALLRPLHSIFPVPCYPPSLHRPLLHGELTAFGDA